MEYKASFDSLTKAISIGIVFVFFIIGKTSVNAIRDVDDGLTRTFINTWIFLFPMIVFAGCYLFSIQKYLIDDHDFIIKRLVGSKKIAIADIKEVRTVLKEEMGGAIRTFGNGGLFGYYGKYYNKALGSMTLYTTQRRNRVLIQTVSGKKIIISPDDLSLVDYLSSKLNSASK